MGAINLFKRGFSRRGSSFLGFILLNVIVTFVTVFGVFSVLQRISPQATERPIAPPLIVVVTATQDPKGTQIAYIVVTTTLGPGVTPVESASAGSGSEVPQGTVQSTNAGGGAGNSSIGTIPTLDPSLLPPSLG